MDALAGFMGRLCAQLQRRGRSREDAEDLVQEAFARFEAMPDRRDVQRPEAFIARVAMNLAVDESRRQRRAPPPVRLPEGYETRDFSPGPAEVMEGRKRLVQMNEGLAALSPRARRILLAQRLDGLSYAEIARREGITVSAVEKQISRALKFLLEWMER